MTGLEFQFLQACAEAVKRQQEVAPLLASHLGVKPSELYYYRMMERSRFEQVGPIAGTDWHYRFHGLECDLANSDDGRYLRIDFGPQGRLDTFSDWGVVQFVMCSQPPWRVFPDLQEHLAIKPPPYDWLSGSHSLMWELSKSLLEAGMVEAADPWLVELNVQHTRQRADGRNVTELPWALTHETLFDSWICDRWVLSEKAWRLLDLSEEV